MKFLLTDSGVTNPSIHAALVDLLGKPIEECAALAVPTASYGHPWAEPVRAWQFVAGRSGHPMTELGWRSVGLLELTALLSLDRDKWAGWVREADVLLVNGGDALYLAHWVRESGLLDLLPTLGDKVWAGFSAGSMVLTPRVGAEFVGWNPAGGDTALGLVDFSIFPHLDVPGSPENSTAAAHEWAAAIGVPAYAIDGETAIKVVGGVPEVVSEGHWLRFNGAA